MSLLVYDDSASIGRLVVRIAGRMGMQATAVTDAASFARRLSADRPPIVVLDLDLGDTSGVDQLRVAAEQNCTSSIVLMSGHDGKALAAAGALGRSLGLKIDGMVQKPLRLADLAQTLGRLRPAQQPQDAAGAAIAPVVLQS